MNFCCMENTRYGNLEKRNTLFLEAFSFSLEFLLQKTSQNKYILKIKVIWAKLGFYVLFSSQGHIGTGSQHCHL